MRLSQRKIETGTECLRGAKNIGKSFSVCKDKTKDETKPHPFEKPKL